MDERYEHLYDRLVDITDEMQGWRFLGDPEELLRKGDETCCISTYVGQYHDGWHKLEGDDWAEYIGKTVGWATDRNRDDMDATERIFRRRR